MKKHAFILNKVEVKILMDKESESKELLTEWGLAIHIRAFYGKDHIDILFDTSITGKKVLANIKTMKLDLSHLEYIVLSHKHFDHTGGLVDILKEKDDWVSVLHGKNFFEQGIMINPFLRQLTLMPFLREIIIKEKGMLTPIWHPLEFAPGFFVSGRIPFVTDFEAPSLPARRMTPPHMHQDEIEDELALTIKLGEEIIVVTGCSHRGIVNIVKNAITITGISNVRAIIGGLHLVSASEERIAKTIQELQTIGVREYYIGHCTGDDAIEQFKSVLGDAVHVTKSGVEITWGQN
ncbi:MAG: MBL fold metallo-hydrolase [candidate division WOR-3 bacterium]|nr:MAG: MBL fold metallo-hydrolase [candidate division WOR-3 bacterium]